MRVGEYFDTFWFIKCVTFRLVFALGSILLFLILHVKNVNVRNNIFPNHAQTVSLLFVVYCLD